MCRDGLMKMKGVYEANSQLGDPMSIEGQLHESGQRLDKLRQELHKYQAYLDDSGVPLSNTPSHNNTLNGVRRHHRWTSNYLLKILESQNKKNLTPLKIFVAHFYPNKCFLAIPHLKGAAQIYYFSEYFV